MRPSRKGGLVSCTSSVIRFSSSSSKSVSTAVCRTTPEVSSRFSSQALLSAFICDDFFDCASVIVDPSRRFSFDWIAACGGAQARPSSLRNCPCRSRARRFRHCSF
eukprot:1020016-Prorocentrum_minimum.AAC.1